MPKKIELMGQTFGRLTVFKEVKKRKNNHVVWLCRCKCGNSKQVRGSGLTSLRTQSCGCYKRERTSEAHKIHGEAGKNETRMYRTWANMIKRCVGNKLKDYGGRGIEVCEAWKKFIVFRDWALAHGYREDLEIDRIDNDGNYCPNNCRWTTRKVNARNTSRTKWFTIDGVRISLPEWCERYNMPYGVVYQRLTRGWDIVKALATPVKNNGK